MSKVPDTYNPILDVIAAALGVPVEHFFATEAVDPKSGVIALLEAWAAIDDAQGQRRVLSFAQHEAERAVEVTTTPRAEGVPRRTDKP